MWSQAIPIAALALYLADITLSSTLSDTATSDLTHAESNGMSFANSAARSSGNCLQLDVFNFRNNVTSIYAINITIGTPSQDVAVQLDTRLSGSIVLAPGTQPCLNPASYCEQLGAFDPTSSSSFVNGSIPLQVIFGNASQILAVSGNDTVAIGDAQLKDIPFALAVNETGTNGLNSILGLGYSISDPGGRYEAQSILPALKMQGIISTMTYSVWLNGPDACNGTILFGATDTERFEGPLVVMPIQPNSTGGYDMLQIALTSISFSSDNRSKLYTPGDFVKNAMIDIGTDSVALPHDILNSIAQDLGAFKTLGLDGGRLALPCRYGDDLTAKFTFGFNGPDGASIEVPLSSFLLDTGDILDDGDAVCYLNMGTCVPDCSVFGASFLRYAYAVFDLEWNQIALAQAKFGVDTTNILEISQASIPGATVATATIEARTATTAAIPPSSSDDHNTGIPNVAPYVPHSAPPASFAFTVTSTAIAGAAAMQSGSAVQSSSTSAGSSSPTSAFWELSTFLPLVPILLPLAWSKGL